MNGKLKINDLLQLNEEQLRHTKIRLNMNNGEHDPIELYKKDSSILLGWNYHNNKTYKLGQISVGFVHMGGDKWLLFTVGLITKVLDIPKDSGIGVKFETLKQYEDLFGRVVVEYKNHSQQLFRNAEGIIDNLIVKEIIPTVYTGFDFPGYHKVHLTYSELETIVRGNYPGYQNALGHQKAVYVLTDTSNGKLYVGSATSKYGMLLSRWTSYVNCGHGGNVELKELSFDHIKEYFTYSILENYNENIDDEYILERESYWKEVLDTRKHGYNKN